MSHSPKKASTFARDQALPPHSHSFKSAQAICSLDAVPEDAQAEIVHLTNDAATNRQLASLGILTGAMLRVRRAAPLSGALLVEVAGTAVALGRALARRLRVRMLPHRPGAARRAEP